MNLKNKVILVTGSTTGIGAAIARECVAQGAKVMLHGRDEVRAKALQAELGENVAYVLSDLMEVAVAKKLIEATVTAFGRIDALVNNAGIYPRNRIDDMTEEFFDTVMTVNLKLPLFLCQAAVEQFRKQKTGGAILNIGSINAYTGQTDILVYSASKGALMTMTRNLGDILGRELIRVNQLNVGWTVTETEDALKQKEGFPADWERHIPAYYAPSGRLLRPEDVAKHVAFWVSDLSAPVSGQVYEVEQYPLMGRNLINEINLAQSIKDANS